MTIPCQKEAIIEEMKREHAACEKHIDERLNDGEIRFQRVDDKLDVLLVRVEAIGSLEKRLYIDNGSPSMQTRLDRMERIIKSLMWISGTVIVVIVGEGIILLGRAIAHALQHGG